LNLSPQFLTTRAFRLPSFLLACGGYGLEEFGRKVQLSLVVSAEVGVETGGMRFSKPKLTGIVRPSFTLLNEMEKL
jgi:hypothetical protein